ncbi:hypothetical protein Tco_0747426 [Tanacetum coccineum]|uniref:Uncharacterized protein n=1 Tax=Tanacetum coccineum TaxID=301880 RepID=A0ABQ4YTP1_9ASTR
MIADLKKRVQRLERKKKSRTTGLKRLKKVGMSRRKKPQGRSDDAEMFDINDLRDDEIDVDMLVGEKQEQSTKERELDTSVEESQESQPSITKDKGKGITSEPEVPLKRKDQVALDEDLARNLQAQLEAELIEEESSELQTEEQGEVVKSKKETEESSKGTEDELEPDKSKKVESSEEKAKGSRKKMLEEVKVDDEAELKKHLVIVKDDEIAIDDIPLATKPPAIVDTKLLKENNVQIKLIKQMMKLPRDILQ